MFQTSTKSLQSWPTNGDFLLYKMAAAAILDFRNFKFLTVGTVKTVELRHRAKFRQNQCGRRHLGFLKFQIFNHGDGQEGQTASLCQTSSKSLEPRPTFFDFSRRRLPPSWIFEILNF